MYYVLLNNVVVAQLITEELAKHIYRIVKRRTFFKKMKVEIKYEP